MFLEIISACSDPALAALLSVVRKGLSLIQIIGPILALISLSLHFIRLVKNPDDKKGLKRIDISIQALLLLFFVPMFVNAVMGWMDTSTQFSSCWNNADFSAGTSTYVSPGDEKRTTIYTDPGDYQKGEKKQTATGGGTTGSGTGDREGTGNHSSQRVVFIGDSRTVQMYAYLNGTWNGANYSSGGVHVVGNDVYVAEGGNGLVWMQNTGIPAAQKYFDSNTAIVILMGVNDLGNINKYISYVNSNAASWKSNGSSLYYVSVNPCNGKYSR